jgi:predicted amidophosphoribosyltransferase
MSTKTCRDCGNALEQTARGCPRCALNFEVENMIDRFIWRRLLPGLFLLALTVIAVVYYLLSLH